MWAALAAARTARAAADTGHPADLPEQWAARISWVGTFAVRALTLAPGTWNDESRPAAARCTAIVRGRLPCPAIL